jgi:hypothetical protein
MPLDVDELCTALFITRGDIVKAADLYKITVQQLKREIRRDVRLQRLLRRLGEPPAPVR